MNTKLSFLSRTIYQLNPIPPEELPAILPWWQAGRDFSDFQFKHEDRAGGLCDGGPPAWSSHVWSCAGDPRPVELEERSEETAKAHCGAASAGHLEGKS